MVIQTYRRARKRRAEAGTSIIEATIVLPLIILLVFATAEFGISFTRWNSLTNAVREGARTGVVFRSPCDAGPVETVEVTLDLVTINWIHHDNRIGVVFFEKLWGNNFVPRPSQVHSVLIWVDVNHVVDLAIYAQGGKVGNRLGAGAPNDRTLSLLFDST